MKMKLETLTKSSKAIGSLLAQPLRGKLAFDLGQFSLKVERELKVYNDVQRKLIVKYADKDKLAKVPNQIDGSHKNWPKFISEINEVLNGDVEMGKIPIVYVSNLSGPRIEMTGEAMAQLDWLIKEKK